jgi:hypothetical protein
MQLSNKKDYQMTTSHVNLKERFLSKKLENTLSLQSQTMDLDFGLTERKLLKTGVFMEQEKEEDLLFLKLDGMTFLHLILKMEVVQI